MADVCEHGSLRRKCPDCDNAKLEARIAELERIIIAKDEFLQALYREAGFHVGEQISVAALIARLRQPD
jgi:hypothetical protein